MPVTRTRSRTVKRRSPNPLSEPGITRVDQPSTRTHGYVVRVNYQQTERGWRPKFTAFFGDARYGGQRKALTAARSWLKQLRRTGRPPKRR